MVRWVVGSILHGADPLSYYMTGVTKAVVCAILSVSYASRSLSRPEANYSAHRLEFLSLKWTISEKYHEYLYGNTFTVLTDNNPLTYVLTTAKLDATGHRWLATLAAYDFNIIYRPGSRNTEADAANKIVDYIQVKNYS